MLATPAPAGFNPATQNHQYSQLLGSPNQFGTMQNMMGNPQLTMAVQKQQQQPPQPPQLPNQQAGVNPIQQMAMMLMQGRP